MSRFRKLRGMMVVLPALAAPLLCVAAVIPTSWRFVLVPFLLIVPGWALFSYRRSTAILESIVWAVPVSIVEIVLTSLILYALGIKLNAISVGVDMGVVCGLTAVANVWRSREVEEPSDAREPQGGDAADTTRLDAQVTSSPAEPEPVADQRTESRNDGAGPPAEVVKLRVRARRSLPLA